MYKYSKRYNKNKIIVFLFLLLLPYLNLFFSNNINANEIPGNIVNWQKIKKDSQYIIEKDSNDIMANFRYSISLANLGMVEEAYEHFDLIKDNFPVYNFNRIISPYIKQLEKRPNDILLLNYAAFSSTINSNYKDSILYFEKLIKIEPDNIWIRNYLAATYLEIEEYEKAENEVKKAIKIRDNKYSHLILGYVYYETGYYIKALIELSKSGDLVKKIMNN